MAIRWGILATGSIAHQFAEGVELSSRGVLHAVGSRNSASAEQFAQQHPSIKNIHDSYEALLADPEVDAIYVATPHPEHAAWVIRALNAGKPILCEKPMGLNHPQVMAMVAAAEQNSVFLMEAFMYRTLPQTAQIQAAINEGKIGAVRHIEAQFGFQVPFDAESRLFANHLGGGGIMDVGCYPMSFARLLAGEPTEISGAGYLGETGVDEWASALLSFSGGVTAQISTAVRVNLLNQAIIYGTEGRIEIPTPWNPGKESDWSFRIRGKVSEDFSGTKQNIYAIEADHVAECLEKGLLESPLMSWSDSLGNASALDQWRSEVGVEYRSESSEHHTGPLLGSISLRPTPSILKSELKDLDKPVSRLVMGCDNQPSISHASVMWDDFFERGGNCYDTAHIYGGGSMESLLGEWHQKRGLREDIVVIGKGAHTPNCYPEAISQELDISLDRLQTDYVDVYFMHRDNPEIPIDEFMDALNAEIDRGRIKLAGGSNWTLSRFKEANAWAKEQGKQGLTALSNNFSLARMISPVWPGVEAVSDEFANYLNEQQIALFPWSSQARGFFTDWGASVLNETESQRRSDTHVEPTASELLRVWDSPENRTRRARAEALAKELDVELITVALAYVLHQPFPTFPLIGPRTLRELASSTDASNIQLSSEQVSALSAPIGE